MIGFWNQADHGGREETSARGSDDGAARSLRANVLRTGQCSMDLNALLL